MSDYRTVREINRDNLWDALVDYGIATEGEISVAIHFGGYNLETLESLLFYKTGYRNLAQLMGEEGD